MKNLFKLFFSNISFSLQNIIAKHLIPLLVLGSVHFVAILAHFKLFIFFEWTLYIKFWKFQEVCFIFIHFIHIYPEKHYIMENLKDSFFLYG